MKEFGRERPGKYTREGGVFGLKAPAKYINPIIAVILGDKSDGHEKVVKPNSPDDNRENTLFTPEARYVEAPEDKNIGEINGVIAAEYNKDMRMTRL